MKDKIRKLFTLANDKGATDGERESALDMAHTLMTKYNVQIDLTAEEAKVKMGEIYGKEYTLPWHKLLASAVAYMYVCRMIQYEKGFQFVGRPESIEAAQMTLDWLISQINDIWDKHQETLPPQHKTKEYRYSFRWAAAGRVWGRIREMQEALKADDEKAKAATGCTALVVVESIKQQKVEVDSFMDDLMGNGTIKKGRAVQTRNSGSGYGAGRVAGNSVKITREVSEVRKQLTKGN